MKALRRLIKQVLSSGLLRTILIIFCLRSCFETFSPYFTSCLFQALLLIACVMQLDLTWLPVRFVRLVIIVLVVPWMQICVQLKQAAIVLLERHPLQAWCALLVFSVIRVRSVRCHAWPHHALLSQLHQGCAKPSQATIVRQDHRRFQEHRAQRLTGVPAGLQIKYHALRWAASIVAQEQRPRWERCAQSTNTAAEAWLSLCSANLRMDITVLPELQARMECKCRQDTTPHQLWKTLLLAPVGLGFTVPVDRLHLLAYYVHLDNTAWAVLQHLLRAQHRLAIFARLDLLQGLACSALLDTSV
jgi:hypothetical protein